jgi:site-specific DNA recombinase
MSRRRVTPSSGPPKDAASADAKRVRCAIYTRKSSEEGLNQDFNSLDAQRESGEACIASQKNEGWVCLPDRYDDGGFSGGSMERPALDRLLKDIEAGRIDCVVVYKVDRLSRSLMDFARIMEAFDRKGVSFVSVTQQFNTTSSMGRLTLHILLSFAQFEREIIGERIRDKISALKRKGKWAGGAPVLGYDVDRTNGSPRLVINANEAARVREIFSLYIQKGSMQPVVIGTTGTGSGRVAASAAERGEDVLVLPGVREFSVRIVTCKGRRHVKMWFKLEHALLWTFLDRFGRVPECNSPKRTKTEGDSYKYFKKYGLTRTIDELS